MYNWTILRFYFISMLRTKSRSQGSIILLSPTPQGGGKNSAQGREFKKKKKKREKKRKQKEKKKKKKKRRRKKWRKKGKKKRKKEGKRGNEK